MAQTTASDEPVLIIGAGISGLLLAQHLRARGVPFRLFERDLDLDTRGLGWGLTLHWSLPALRSLLGDELAGCLPDAYVDRRSVAAGESSRFPFYDLATGQRENATPPATEAARIRVTRQGLRSLLATDLSIEVPFPLPQTLASWTDYLLVGKGIQFHGSQ
jgi:cation diffusion facilitator CzcD-associated flavoprotein CzcO